MLSHSKMESLLKAIFILFLHFLIFFFFFKKNMSLIEISQALLSHGWFLCSSVEFLTSTYKAFPCMFVKG